jgi:ADP-ribose pyrophosphatase
MDLFLYGTLCHQPLRDVVLGGAPAMTRPARLAGHAVYWGKGQSYPVLLAETESVAEGLLLHLPEAAVAARIDFYEGGFGYALKPVTVETDDGPAAAQVYMPEHAGLEPGAPWSLADWAEKWGELSVLAAEEAMGEFGRLTPDALARAFPMMRVRAASRLRAARTLRPATLRADTAREGVELEVHRRPYSAFFAVEEHDIRFPRFDGSMSETVNRAAFVMGDVITVLPYDPVRDAVHLFSYLARRPAARSSARRSS